MALEKLDKAAWAAYFDAMSKGLVGRRVEIEVASLQIGDQILASWLPLFGIAYDPKDDVLEIALEGHDHLIHRPRELFVESPMAWSTLGVIDGDGVLQIVRLRELLMLPEHSEAG
jgi:hypothetical protein